MAKIKRTPVSKEGFQRIAENFKGGINRPEVTTGPVDEIKGRIAKKVTGAGGFGLGRQAGMMLDQTGGADRGYSSGYALEAYRTSYSDGLNFSTGNYDVPTYFVQMNEQNGGVLYWPVTLQEKYQWYRYWARSDAYVGRSLELLADLPMSKLTLNMPKMEGKEELREEILEFFTWQCEILNLFDLLQSALWEVNMIGNVFIFHEWDEEKKMWSRAVMLPPEEVFIFQYPFSDEKRVDYRPRRLIELIKGGGAGGSSSLPVGDEIKDNLNEDIVEHIPDDLKEMVDKTGVISMDSDPMTGSFVHHIARRRSPYEDLGASVLERVLVPMLQKEHYRYAQLSLASRNMTPKNLITAPGLLPAEVDDLRTQVDLSYLDPDYSIISNYEVQWEQIGTSDRLLQLDSEYERIENQVFAAMGVTRELLTGEGHFSGNKITVEILNTMFLLVREALKNYVEKQLFIPICEAHEWYEDGKNGVRHYYYPNLAFNRLTIRDNAEVFDSLYQLYQKGSLPIEVIYELFNLNAEEMEAKLYEGLFKVNDSTFNRLVEEVNSETGRSIAEKTNIVNKTAEYLGLEITSEGEGEEDDMGFGGGFGDESSFGGSGDESQPSEEETQEPALETDSPEVEDLADEVADALPSDASEQDIDEAVEHVTQE